MDKYDPNIAPEPVDWLELDEQERVSLVEACHKAAKVKPPNLTLHAAVHVVVENQVAEEHPSTVAAIARLMKEGLSRHDSVHAVGAVVAEHLFVALSNKDKNFADTAQARFDAAIGRLSAKGWLRDYGK